MSGQVVSFGPREAQAASDLREELRRALSDPRAWVGKRRVAVRLDRGIVARFVGDQRELFHRRGQT